MCLVRRRVETSGFKFLPSGPFGKVLVLLPVGGLPLLEGLPPVEIRVWCGVPDPIGCLFGESKKLNMPVTEEDVVTKLSADVVP